MLTVFHLSLVFSAMEFFQSVDVLLHSLQNFVDLGVSCQDFQGHSESFLVIENRDVYSTFNKSQEERRE